MKLDMLAIEAGVDVFCLVVIGFMSSKHKKRATINPPAKRHSNGVSLAG